MPSHPRELVVSAARSALVAAAIVWAGLVVAAPWLGSRGGVASTTAAAVYFVGGWVCHQRPERSFHLLGLQLPVCARCAGLYLSAAAGLAAAAFWWSRRGNVSLGSTVNWRPWLAATALPTALTLTAEWTGVWTPSNAIRALAGVPLGVVAGAVLADALSFRGKL